MEVGNVVQFNENHKWCGCLGVISRIKNCRSENAPGGDIKYMVGVPIPERGTAYIYVLASEFAIEKIGQAILSQKDEED